MMAECNTLDPETVSLLPTRDTEKATRYLRMGQDAFTKEDFANAETFLWHAISFDERCSDAWQLLGLIARGQNSCVAASAMFRRAVELAPENADAWLNLGESLQNSKRVEEAERCLMKSITLKPDQYLAWNNIGVVFEHLGQTGKAERAMRRALELNPGYDMPRVNLTRLYMQTGKHAKAMEEAEIAIKTCGDSPQAHFNYSLCLLQNGRWEEGWREYEHRWRLPGFTDINPVVKGPCWNGSNPKGKTILLFAEQGFGDTIQFSRYAKPIADAGGRVYLWTQDKVARLMCHVPGVAHAFGRSEGIPTFDYCAPLMSLPYLFESTPETVTAGMRYIQPPKSELWAERLGAIPGLKIGVCYAGNPEHANDKARSMKPNDLAPLMEAPEVSFVSLQFDRREDTPLQMFEYAPDVNDFLDSAQLIDQLDMVITVDTAVAHLAGSLGKPTLLLLPHSSDFRWLLKADRTPWYPSIRILRKPVGESWRDFVRREVFPKLLSDIAVAA